MLQVLKHRQIKLVSIIILRRDAFVSSIFFTVLRPCFCNKITLLGNPIVIIVFPRVLYLSTLENVICLIHDLRFLGFITPKQMKKNLKMKLYVFRFSDVFTTKEMKNNLKMAFFGFRLKHFNCIGVV